MPYFILTENAKNSTYKWIIIPKNGELYPPIHPDRDRIGDTDMRQIGYASDYRGAEGNCAAVGCIKRRQL